MDYRATISTNEYTAKVSGNVIVNVVTAEHYAGPYSVTPSENEQTLETGGKHMDGDVVVAPIPSNYGLITQVGAGIRVS